MYACPDLQSLSEEEHESFLEKMLDHVKKKGGPYKMQEHAANKKRKLAKDTKVSEPAGLSGKNTTLKRDLRRRPTPLKNVKLRQTSTIRPLTSTPSVKKKHQPGSVQFGQFDKPLQLVEPNIGGRPIPSGQLGGGPSHDAAIGNSPPQPSAVKFVAIRATTTTTTTSSPADMTTKPYGTPLKEDQDQIRCFYQPLSPFSFGHLINHPFCHWHHCE